MDLFDINQLLIEPRARSRDITELLGISPQQAGDLSETRKREHWAVRVSSPHRVNAQRFLRWRRQVGGF